MAAVQLDYQAGAATKTQPQVDSQIQRLEMNSDALEKQIEELAQRLVPVSRSIPPSPISGDKNAETVENLCPMADSLRLSNERFGRLVNRLAEMRGLLEI